jgi:hypothetical protein
MEAAGSVETLTQLPVWGPPIQEDTDCEYIKSQPKKKKKK